MLSWRETNQTPSVIGPDKKTEDWHLIKKTCPSLVHLRLFLDHFKRFVCVSTEVKYCLKFNSVSEVNLLKHAWLFLFCFIIFRVFGGFFWDPFNYWHLAGDSHALGESHDCLRANKLSKPQNMHEINRCQGCRLLAWFNWGYAVETLIACFMGSPRGTSGADRTQVGPMLAPCTLLSGKVITCIIIWGM